MGRIVGLEIFDDEFLETTEPADAEEVTEETSDTEPADALEDEPKKGGKKK
jgi:hypothetical protein